MSDTAVCDGEALAAQAALARVLLDFGKAPGRYSLRLGEPAALHAQLDTLALWALGRIPEPLQAQAAALQEAAVLFVQRLCFAPDNTHYQVLALAPQHLNPEALRARYRTLIRLTHPDMGVRGLPQNAAGLVNRAHEVLGSAVLRSTYDQQLAQAAARLRTPPPAPLQAGRSPGAPPAGARGRTGQNAHAVPATAPWLHKGPRRAMAEQWQALNARFPALLRFGAVAGSTGLLVAGVLAWAAMDAQKSGGLVVSSDPQANTAAAAAAAASVSGAAAAAATTTATATATATAIPMANPAPASAQKTGPLVPPKAVAGLSASVTPSPVQAPTPAPAFVRLQAAVAPEAPAPAAPADPALLRRAEPKAMATPATPAAPVASVAAPAAPLAAQAAPPAKPQPQPQPQPQSQPQPPSLAATAAAASGRVAVPQDAAPRLAQAVKAVPAPVPAPAPIPAPISAPASVAVAAVAAPVSAPTAAPAPGAVAAPAAAVAAPAAAPMTAPAVSVAAVPAPSAAKAVVDPAQARSYLVDLLRALERPSDAQRAQAFLGRMNVQGSLLAAPLQLARQSAAVQVTGIALSPVRPDTAAAGAAESSLALGGTLELQTSGGSSSNADAASAAAPQGRKARYQVQAHFIATAQGAALARLDLREVE